MAPTGPPTSNLKRKQPSSHTTSAKPQNNPKRVKTFSARTIISQLSEKALNKNGELDVSSFVKAREYEIRALESSMHASKKALTTRAFQQVPRELRRRTASHNVKRVPKRLRARAAKEVRSSYFLAEQRSLMLNMIRKEIDER
jgi:ribonuclease P/MRP protein subunit POP1